MHAVHAWLAPALPLQGVALFALHAVAILAVGAALHHGVERPCLRLRDRLAKRQAAATPSAITV
jgi:peptidoglycan/LPS O-acetylase OafA/YrhL